MRAGDQIRTVIEWGCFRHTRGTFLEMRGERPIVLLDGFVAPVLLFANEVVLDDPTKPLPCMGAE